MEENFRYIAKESLLSLSLVHHTVMEKVLVLWHVLGMPLCQGSCMDPIWPETEIGEILEVHPPELGAQVTPGMSLGTKIFVSKFFS